ncbi:MAG: GNAT family N-acetyltransferase [Dehalococcoidia bacterium]|nr:GNAT family N-acetyltransferase [Dehalococcoidia bacterium]
MTLVVQWEPLGAVTGEWPELFTRSATQSIFLSLPWQTAWAIDCCGSVDEHPVLTVRENSDGSLRGIAPLNHGKGSVTFGLDYNVTDYQDILSDPGEEESVWEAILDYGVSEGWASIELTGVRDDSPSTQILESRASEHGWRADRSVWDVSPYVELPESWDEHVQSLSKKDRHELRRKLRRLEASGDAEYRIYDHEHDELPEALESFVSLMGKSSEAKSDFLTPERRSFLETLTRTMADADSLQLAFLDVGGKPVSATMSFLEGDRLLLYNSGYDPEYRHLSVGLLLKAYELRGAIEQGLREYDFLRGNEPYKYDLGGNDRVLYRWQLARESEAP